MSKYYTFGEVILTSQDWVREYLTHINGFIERHGGRVLSRTVNMDKREGERALPTNVILIEWPSKDAADACFNDPDYQPLKARRQAGSKSEFVGFPAEDLIDAFKN
jgi:uncharacterized protein (DUF1330 family)